MLVFGNYTHSSKKFRNYASTVYFKFGKKKLCNRQVNGKYIYPIYN